MKDEKNQELSELIRRIGNQTDKDYLNAMINSNGHAISKIQSLTDHIFSSNHYEQKLERYLATINLLKLEITRTRKFNLYLKKLNTKEAQESLSHSLKNLIEQIDQLRVVKAEFKKIELTYGFMRVKELEREQEQNQKTKFVILTEDERTEILDAILKSNNYTSDNSRIFSLKGVNKNTYINSLELIRFLSPNSVIIVHRDRDWLTSDEIQVLEKDAQRFNFYLMMPEGYDIESYLINTSHILELYPQMDERKINELIDLAREDRRNSSIGKMYSSKKFGDKRECEKLYDSNPVTYSYTKHVLGALAKRLSEEYQIEIDLAKPSKFLELSILKQVFALG